MRLAAGRDGELRIYQHLVHVPLKNGFAAWTFHPCPRYGRVVDGNVISILAREYPEQPWSRRQSYSVYSIRE
jgi:hypothetical protein